MRIADAVEVKEPPEIGLLDADAVEFDAADLGACPAEALSHLIARKTGALTEPAQFGGEPTAADGRAAVVGHPSGSPRVKLSRLKCEATSADRGLSPAEV